MREAAYTWQTQIAREGQAPAGDADAANLARNAGDDPECTDDFPSAATQPEALGTDNPNPSGSAFGRGMQDRDRRSRQSLQRGDADVFVFGDDTARGNGSYWSGDQIYGYRGEEDERGAGAAPAGGAVGSVITDQASDGTPHEWSQGQNLIDDNFTQTRDSFDVPGDFYTKEWKVGQPPLAAHPHFRTIYDDDTTDQYYTPWFGSPVTWAPNKMVPVALPAATHEMLTDRQLVTYFTTWRDRDTQSTIPGQLVAGGVITNVSLATAGGNADIYGYRGEDSAEMEGAPRSEAPRDGALHLGSTTLYWDDQDVIGGGNVHEWIEFRRGLRLRLTGCGVLYRERTGDEQRRRLFECPHEHRGEHLRCAVGFRNAR